MFFMKGVVDKKVVMANSMGYINIFPHFHSSVEKEFASSMTISLGAQMAGQYFCLFSRHWGLAVMQRLLYK